MKKTLLLIPIVAMLAACGTTDKLGDRAEYIRKAEIKDRERVIDQTPDWYFKVPVSNSAIYKAGMGQASSPSMAVHLASVDAYAQICAAAEGQVTSQTKDFATESSKTSRVERATRTNCNNVSIAGVENGDVKGNNPKVISTRDGYTAYILVALPTGDANVQRKYLDNRKREEREQVRATEAFKELPKVQ
jgi:hypothetical protein